MEKHDEIDNTEAGPQDDIQESYDLNLNTIGTLNTTFVKALIDQLLDTEVDQQDLFERVQSHFAHIARVSNTSQTGKGPALALTEKYATDLKKKVASIGDAVALKASPKATPEELAKEAPKVCSKVFFEVARIISEQLKTALLEDRATVHAANILLSVSLEVLTLTIPANKRVKKSKQSIQSWSHPNLDTILVALLNTISQSRETHLYLADAERLFQFFLHQTDFNLGSLISKLKDVSNQAAFLLLGKFLHHASATDAMKAEINTFLSEKCKEVFNDKNHDAITNCKNFVPFFEALTEKQFLAVIVPELQILLKRTICLLPNIETLAKSMKFTFTNQVISALTVDLIPKEYLVAEHCHVFKSYVDALKTKVPDQNAFYELFGKKFVLGYMDETRTNTSQPREDRFAFLSIAVHALGSDENSHRELLEQIADFIFKQSKTELEIPKTIANFVEKSKHTEKVFSQLASKLSWSTEVKMLVKAKFTDQKCLDIVVAQVKTLLKAQGLTSSTNSTQLLTFMSFLCHQDRVEMLLQSDLDGHLKWLTQERSLPNTLTFIREQASVEDLASHMHIISCLLFRKGDKTLSTEQNQVMLNTFLEFLLNSETVFRNKALFSLASRVSAHWTEDEQVIFFNSLFAKFTQLFEKKVTAKEMEDGVKQPSCSIPHRIRILNSLVLMKDSKPRQLNAEQFLSLIKVISHPYVSGNVSQLKIQICELERIYSFDTLKSMFDSVKDTIIQQFLMKRTGLLSPDATVRLVASNVLVCMSWAGLLDLLLPHMVKILNYKPVEMIDRMEQLFETELSKKSPYDVMYWADLTKKMLVHFKQSDEALKDSVLCRKKGVYEEIVFKEEVKVEEVAEPEVKQLDLAAMLKKKAAAATAMKGTKGKKNKYGKPEKVEFVPKAAEAAKKPEPIKVEIEELSREDRQKVDQTQLALYISTLRLTKTTQVGAVFKVIREANLSPNAERLHYQDLTLIFITPVLEKLLSLPATKFDASFFLKHLFGDSTKSPFFKIKEAMQNCMLAIAANKMSQKIAADFTLCLSFLEKQGGFAGMGEGSLQLILTLGNYVLRDPSVNLSVKEKALVVAQSILDTNVDVKMTDMVRLTVNMLKTNYISPNLGGFLKKLLARMSREEIAMVLIPMFEYQPVPRKVLLTELHAFEEPLFSPTWFSTQIWVTLFDEELGPLARKIWNKFGLTMNSDSIAMASQQSDKNLLYYLQSQNYTIFALSVKATAFAVELFGNTHLPQIVEDLVAFYQQEWEQIEKLSALACIEDYTKDKEVQKDLIADQRVNRIAVPQILKKIATLFDANQYEAVFDFLIPQACQDKTEEVRNAACQAAFQIITNKAEQDGGKLIAVLEAFLDNEKYTNKSKEVTVMLIAQLAPFLEQVSQKKTTVTFDKLVELLKVPDESLRASIVKCIPQLTRFFPDKARVVLTANFKILKESAVQNEIRAAAFAVAGIMKALGMNALVESDCLNMFNDDFASKKKADPLRKQAGLFLYEALSISMGRSFEVFLPQVFSKVLASIADVKEPVRKAGLSTLMTIMNRFSHYAIKQALPQFLAELENDNWRSKMATVEALGNLAQCAPRQVADFLPQIVGGLREVMNDTHELVNAAALEAINKIGTVIKCPEIGDMLELIIKALSQSDQFLNEALNLLLETSFVHAIDAPSLSLLVPLLDNGLMRHDNKSKKMASQLMGNICSLVHDPKHLLPYMSILQPAIKNSLFDSIPEIRASSARALGSLSKGLGIENSVELIDWLKKQLDETNLSSAEKSGAAQGLAEIMSVHGIEFFEKQIALVLEKVDSPSKEFREAYRGVIMFLPSSFEKFTDYLPRLIPVMINGLSDEQDEIRKISMRNVKICIKMFGKSHPEQLVQPILSMMFAPDFRVRQSSSILMYQLVKELENDVIKAQPKYLTMETKHQILASMFILKYDTVERVQVQAGQIWKSLIDNQVLILRQVIETMIRLVFSIIQTDSEELQAMGLATIRGLVEKFGEKLVMQALDIFEDLLEKSTDQSHAIGISRVLHNMASAASYKLLQGISTKLIKILEPNLVSESTEIRTWSAKVFITLFQRQSEKEFVDPVLKSTFLEKLSYQVLAGETEECNRLLLSLKQMLENASALKLEDRLLVLCNITDKVAPFTTAQALVIKALAPTIASKVYQKRFYHSVLTELEEELNAKTIDDPVRIQSVLMAYAELISHLPVIDAESIGEELYKFNKSCLHNNRPAFYVDFMTVFCGLTRLNLEKMADVYLKNVLSYINHEDVSLVGKVVKCINTLFDRLEKETQYALTSQIREAIEQVAVVFEDTRSLLNQHVDLGSMVYRKKMEEIAIFKSEEGIKLVVTVSQAAIMHGSVQVRVDAALVFKYMLEFTPTTVIKKEIIKICGALIRVVNDKFPQNLKLQIFQTLKLIQMKHAASAKAMQAQLQTTFLKALGDQASTPLVRTVVISNLLLLVEGLPRVDPIIKELISLVESSKLDNDAKANVSMALALVIRSKGDKISGGMSEIVCSTLTQILQDHKAGFNEKVLANCAACLAFLSAFSANLNEMVTLFHAFQEDGRDCISIPVKLGVLINGNEKLDKKVLAKELSDLLTVRLVDAAGFQETDDDPAPIAGGDDETFKFKGSLDLIAHFADSFMRQNFCVKADSSVLALVFDSVNKSAVISKIALEDKICEASFTLLSLFFAQIPVRRVGDKLGAELSQLLKDGFSALQKHYLEFGNLNTQACGALLNMLQLNFDNFIDVGCTKDLELLFWGSVKNIVETEPIASLISDDMKMYTADMLFKKK